MRKRTRRNLVFSVSLIGLAALQIVSQAPRSNGEENPPAEPAATARQGTCTPASPALNGGAAAVPAPQPGQQAPKPLHEVIDQLIDQGYQARGVKPAENCSDADFLRRIYLDLTGMIPTLGESRAFLESNSPIKRQQLVDRLIYSPEYARHMSRVFDVLLMERRPAEKIPQADWEAYLFRAFSANKPYDELVRELLASDGADESTRAASRFILDRGADPFLMTRDTGRVLLGMDYQCAQCHDHPLINHYVQRDYYGLFAFFSRSTIFVPKGETKSLIADKADGDVQYKSVFIKGDSDHAMRPHLPGEPEIEEPQMPIEQAYEVAPADNVRPIPKYSRRRKLAEILPRGENRAFTKNIVNRLWAMMMGRGLVHPVDMHHPSNPASHPELLDVMADRFVEMRFDIQSFVRELALTRVYQLSSEYADPDQRPQEDSFAVAALRPLSPSQLGMSVLQASGQADTQRISLGASLNEAALHERLTGNLAIFVQLYGGQAGQVEEGFQTSLAQTLFVSNSETIRSWLAQTGGALVDRLTRAKDDQALAEEFYLSVLNRKPSPEEVELVKSHLNGRMDRVEALQELSWALIASTEFRFNH